MNPFRAERRRSTSLLFAITLLAVPLFAASASAQQVSDPTRAEFNPSPDHNATASGTPLVQSYLLEFYLQGSPTPLQTTSLGKPNPDTDGIIRVNLVSAFSGWPVPGTLYEAAVVAIGPGGQGRSARSNPFVFSVPCSWTVSPLTPKVAGTAGNGTVSVTTTAGCGWTAVSNANWITITSGANGTTSGPVNYSVTANLSTSTRTGTMTIAGQAVTVTQSAGCTYSLSPTSQAAVPGGNSYTTTVTTAAGCAWTSAESAAWITMTAGSSGSGPGATTYSVTPNTTGAARSATMTIAGVSFNVTQNPCTYTTTPPSQNVVAAGATHTATVTAPANCSWTATEAASWITITSGSSGSGNGTTTYSVSENTALTTRSATLTVAGNPVNVTQAAAACNYSVTPTSVNVTEMAGTGGATVTAQTGCNWTATSNASWIIITSGSSGNGNGTTNYSFAVNNSSSARTGTLTIANTPVTVIQAGATPPSMPDGFRIVDP